MIEHELRVVWATRSQSWEHKFGHTYWTIESLTTAVKRWDENSDAHKYIILNDVKYTDALTLLGVLLIMR